MSILTEDRDAIDALPLNEWATVRVGLVNTMETTVVVISRSVYLAIVEDLLDEYEGRLPASLHEALMKTAREADRFALGSWVHDTRGCGCLVGEYLIARDQINAHNLDLDAMSIRDHLAKMDMGSGSIEERLRRDYDSATAARLITIGEQMDSRLKRHLTHSTDGHAPAYGTVFIRDEV